MKKRGLFVCLVAFAILSAASEPSPKDWLEAIRANDIKKLRSLAASGGVNSAVANGYAPLHLAAGYGSVEAVRLLLAAGADVKSTTPYGATPLFLAIDSKEKVQLLLRAGADPNAATKSGRTPLISAATQPGALGTVKLLLEAGARLDAMDYDDVTALLAASGNQNPEMVSYLLQKGAKVTVAKTGTSVLLGVAKPPNATTMRLLLSHGAKPNDRVTFAGKVRFGNIELTGLTPLIAAAAMGSVERAELLLKAGAPPDGADDRGMTPLMIAVAAEHQDLRLVNLLLGAGANVNAADKYGETVLDWARKFNNPDILQALQSAGARASSEAAKPLQANVAYIKENNPRLAVERGMALLHKASSEFFRQSGCTGCHHQPITGLAHAKAQASGLIHPETNHKLQTESLVSSRPVLPALEQMIDVGGATDQVTYALLGWSSAGLEANLLTDAAVRYLMSRQAPDGSWSLAGVSRAPFEESDITRTGLAVRALQAYSWPARQKEIAGRVAEARRWLLQAQAKTAYEAADKLLGLTWAGARKAELQSGASVLVRLQRSDGGWSQNPNLQSDAYATGLALHALSESGTMRPEDALYQRGVQYLLSTQHGDGSWYVKSRSPKFQPYFESGFPHGHDQWISTAATAYAVMGLAPAAKQSMKLAQR